MDLYTSLVRLKQEMNGGVLPPMMPVPESVRGFIDPAFTIGLGALEEHAEKGLRCPVRGCGQYRHILTRHLNTIHRDIGGVNGVKRALSIPRTASLCSQRRTQMLRDRAIAMALGRVEYVRRRSVEVFQEARKRGGRSYSADKNTVGAKNLRDRCIAQLSHKLIDLHHEIGRSPSAAEFANKHSGGLLQAVQRAFGSWNNAKEHCGLEAYPPRGLPASQHQARREKARAGVLAALSAWYDAHGALPSTRDAEHARRAPLLPRYETIINAMGVNGDIPRGRRWAEAMRRAASFLNIYGGRYGLRRKRIVA